MPSENSRSTTLIISAILGAIFGIFVGQTLLKRSEEQDRPTITAREGVSLGMLLMGLFRQVSQLGDGD